MAKNVATSAVDQFLNSILDYLSKSVTNRYEISIRDFRILLFIHRMHEDHKVTVSELARHLSVTPAAASQMVTGYETKGWIDRVRSKEDRRTVYISVSEKLLKLFNDEWEKFHEILGKDLASLSNDDLLGFARTLSVIDKHFREQFYD